MWIRYKISNYEVYPWILGCDQFRNTVLKCDAFPWEPAFSKGNWIDPSWCQAKNPESVNILQDVAKGALHFIRESEFLVGSLAFSKFYHKFGCLIFILIILTLNPWADITVYNWLNVFSLHQSYCVDIMDK